MVILQMFHSIYKLFFHSVSWISGPSSILKLSDLPKKIYVQLFGNSSSIQKFTTESIKIPFLS